jgi:hypothetical protein
MMSEETRETLSGMSREDLKRLIAQSQGITDQDEMIHAVVVLWAFSQQEFDDGKIAAHLGIPIEDVFLITGACEKYGIWKRLELNVDEGVEFSMMILASRGRMEYLPDMRKWRLTEVGLRQAEDAARPSGGSR